jgi:hypothetical protein
VELPGKTGGSGNGALSGPRPSRKRYVSQEAGLDRDRRQPFHSSGEGAWKPIKATGSSIRGTPRSSPLESIRVISVPGARRAGYRVQSASNLSCTSSSNSSRSRTCSAAGRDRRGCSSAGRAPDLHSGGRRFDPDQLHQQAVSSLQQQPGRAAGTIGSSRRHGRACSSGG